jgi:hypothetical protein
MLLFFNGFGSIKEAKIILESYHREQYIVVAKILRFKTDSHDCVKISQTKDEKEKEVTEYCTRQYYRKFK